MSVANENNNPFDFSRKAGLGRMRTHPGRQALHV